MSYTSHWKSGSYRVQCDRCGFDYRAEELRREWTGLRVCRQCFEHRHPQEFIRAVKEHQPPWTRPEPSDVYLVGTNVIVGNVGMDGTIYNNASVSFTNNKATNVTYSNITVTGFNQTYSTANNGSVLVGTPITEFTSFTANVPAPIPSVLTITQDFSGADGTNVLTTTTDEGHTWSKYSTQPAPVIRQNHFTNGYAICSANVSNSFTMEIDVNAPTSFVGGTLFFGYESDNNNYYLYYLEATRWAIDRYDAPDSTTIAQSDPITMNTATNYAFKLVRSGDNVKFYIDNDLKIDSNGFSKSNVGKIGIGALTVSGTPRFQNLYVEYTP